MKKNFKLPAQFAICVNTDDPDLLTPRMIYRILPDESAAKSKYIRVVDNEGEDYLYPANYFVAFDFPQPIERTLLRLGRQPDAPVDSRPRIVSALKRKTKPTAA